MRVLMIIHTLGHGGAENIFRWLAWQLRNQGIDVRCAIPEAGGGNAADNWIGPALQELGIEYLTFDKLGTSLDLLRNLMSLIRATGPDIVHSHLLDSNFYSAVACRWMSVPHICTEHGDILFNHSKAGRLKFFLLGLFSHTVVCVSRNVRDAAVAKSFPPEKIMVIRNGIRIQSTESSSFRKEFGIPETALLIGSVGNLYPVKGQQYLIQAFARFLQEFPDSYLVLVGRGRDRDTLENLRDRLEIPRDRVFMTGFRDDVGNILAGTDIYVQPSLSEGLPVALLEAMSHGIPVIATDVGGTREILEDGRHGELIHPGSPDGALERMRAVAQDLETYRRKAVSLKDHVLQKFSLRQMADQYIQAYEKILDRDS